MDELKKSINQAIDDYQLPLEWSKQIIDEVSKISFKLDTNRTNLTDLNFITIDGADAKDFDDAVYCSQKSGIFSLFVAIADVSNLVEEGSMIDIEASKRGTSIYFPNKVIPMFHERISNDLCSLVPDKDRNALVAEIKFDEIGKVQSYKFYDAVICSKKRFTYSEAEEAINNNSFDNQGILKSLVNLKNLTTALLRNRKDRRALEINSIEPQLKIDKYGKIKKISIPKTLFSHRMIEESMIAANVCAADFLKNNNQEGVYRIHEEPDLPDISNLKNYFLSKGMKSSKPQSSIDLFNSFFKFVYEDKKRNSLAILILQSLKRAEYSTKEIAHFGLQLDNYTHFTSPIRRYPDLLVHRLIKAKINNKESIKIKNLENLLINLSSLEVRAEKSSRQVIQQMLCYFLKRSVGNNIQASIVGMADFGIFAELEGYYVSGLIHFADLPNDRYYFSKKSNIIKGKRTGTTYRLGQKIEVKVVNVYPETRKITLIPSRI